MLIQRSIKFIVVFTFILTGFPGNPQEVKTYTTQSITSAIQIDGQLQEPIWRSVPWGTDFHQTEPHNGASPTFQTQFKILHDQHNLYVGIKAFDHVPDSIIVADSPRDFFVGDYVEINIDSDLDRQDAFSFTVTAGGIRGDEFIRTSDHWDNDWNPKWTAHTTINEAGWVAEMKIPLSELRYFRKVDQWGIQVNRSIERLDEGSSWSPVPDEDQWVSSFGTLTGMGSLPVAPPPYGPDDMINPDLLRRDLESLYQTLQNSYPSLNRYQTSSAINNHFNQSLMEIGNGQRLVDFYKTVAYFLSKIGDGHMNVSLPEYYLRDFHHKPQFPFLLDISEQTVLIRENYSDNPALDHAELLAINQVPIRQIIDNLIQYIPGDGLHSSGKYHQLASSFAFYYSLWDPATTSPELEYLPIGQQEAASITLSQLNPQHLDQTKVHDRRDPFEFKIHQDAAIMRISTFNHPRLFEDFADKSFAQMDSSKTSLLILDLRGNGGGEESNAIHLYTYLAEAPALYYDHYAVNPNTTKAVDLTMTMISGETHQFLGSMAKTYPDGSARLVSLDRLPGRFVDPAKAIIPTTINHYDGQLAVLIDGGSFSATSELCAVLKRDQRAVFVGEETGGAFDGNTSGIYEHVALPHSGITIRIPLVKYVSAVQNVPFSLGSGILPDFHEDAIMKRSDYAGKKDPLLEFAIDLLRSNKNGQD